MRTHSLVPVMLIVLLYIIIIIDVPITVPSKAKAQCFPIVFREMTCNSRESSKIKKNLVDKLFLTKKILVKKIGQFFFV